MGVFSFEQNRQYAVRTEVLALITLVEYGDHEQKHNALKQLTVMAYPQHISFDDDGDMFEEEIIRNKPIDYVFDEGPLEGE